MSLTLARLCGEWRLVSKAQNSKLENNASDSALEIGKPLKKFSRKSESHWRNPKAVEEDFLGFLGNWKAVEENWILSEENLILGEGNLNIRKRFHDISERLSIDPSWSNLDLDPSSRNLDLDASWSNLDLDPNWRNLDLHASTLRDPHFEDHF